MELRLKARQRRDLSDALISAFPDTQTMALMVQNCVDPTWMRSLQPYKPPELFANDVITLAEARCRVIELLEGARLQNPTSLPLLRFTESLGVEPSSTHLEAMVRERGRINDIESFLGGLRELHLPVCKVIVRSRADEVLSLGTGFLVASDTIITNDHVVRPVREGTTEPGRIEARFGYKLLADGKEAPGTGYGAVNDSESWLISGSKTGDLDYAAIKLEGEPGDDPAGQGRLAGERGWIELPHENSPDSQTGDPVFVIEHPKGDPMGISFGKILKTDSTRPYFSHDAPTHPGSSGSPVFNADTLAVVGLHYYGADRENRAIQVNRITRHRQGGAFS